MQYIVYKYTFNDGTVYIGRSRTTQNRFDNPSQYAGQEVYKHFLKGYKAEILCTTDNIFECCYLESKYIAENYENSHNGSLEETWWISAARECKTYDELFVQMMFFQEKYKLYHFKETDCWLIGNKLL